MADTETTFRDRLEERAQNKAEDTIFTFNQHFLVANFYRFINRASDTALLILSFLLLSTQIMGYLSTQAPVLIALGLATITAYRRSVKPDKRSQAFRESAREYHTLYDEIDEFLKVQIPSDERYSDEEVKSIYDDLIEKRRELNGASPDASQFWYYYLKYIRGEETVVEQTTTKDRIRQILSGN